MEDRGPRQGRDSVKDGQWEKHIQAVAQMRALQIPVPAAHFTAAIKACCKLARPDEGLELWHAMRASGVPCPASTYACLVSGFIKTKQWARALELYNNVAHEPFEASVITYNSAISAATNRAHPLSFARRCNLEGKKMTILIVVPNRHRVLF